MANLSLTLACDYYDLIWPLKAGGIQPNGIDLRVLTIPTVLRNDRMIKFGEFDACEIGLTHWFVDRLGPKRFKAIPVFIRRMFLHRCIYCHVDAKIHSMEDLKGKRVGTRRSNTLILGVRGLLQHELGIKANEIKWVTDVPDLYPSPKEIPLETLSPGKNLEDLLVGGELDAMVVPHVIEPFLKGSPGVRRLFPDYKREEVEYYRKTRMFPIMHLIVLKEEVLRREPWVAVNLVEAFREAKRQRDEYLKIPPRSGLAWASALWEEERAILGEDPWADNVRDNIHVLETFMQYAVEQGLIRETMDVREMFVESTLEM